MKQSLFDCCKKSIKVSLVVGTILSLVNQGDAILNNTLSLQDALRIFFNFLIPLLVSTYSRLALLKEMKNLQKQIDSKKGS